MERRFVLGAFCLLGAFAALALALLPATPPIGPGSGARSLTAPRLGVPADRATTCAPAAGGAEFAEKAVVIEKKDAKEHTAAPILVRHPAAAIVRAPVPDMSAPPDPEQVLRAALKLAQPAFEVCYQTALKVDQRVRGRMVVELSVLAAGAVGGTRIVESTVTDERVKACIARRLRNLQLPPLGADLAVTVPLSLVPRTG